MLGCIPAFSVEDLCNPLQSLQNLRYGQEDMGETAAGQSDSNSRLPSHQ